MRYLADHRSHLVLLVVAMAGVMFLGWGIGAAVALAVLGCAAMFGVILWLVASESRRKSTSERREYEPH